SKFSSISMSPKLVVIIIMSICPCGC
ncbi:hypothetical protein D037_1111B, partial [Vibrio parahaemolyticus IDH02640]